MKKFLLFFLILLILPIVTADWYDAGFQSCRNITINNPTSSTLTNIPNLLNISIASNMQSDLDDLRIVNNSCNNNGSLIPAELDNYTASIAYIWASLTLAPGNNTISIYYGNTSVSNAWNKTGVWDSNYLIVAHMNDVSDSTNNSYNISVDGGTTINTGMIGKGYYFNGSQTMAIANNISAYYTAPLTIEMYINFVSVGTGTIQQLYQIRNASSGKYPVNLQATASSKKFTFSIENNTGTTKTASGSYVQNNNTWIMTGGYISSSRVEALANGAVDGTGISYTGTIYSIGLNRQPRFGASGVGGSQYFKGTMDEFRLSKIQRSEDWLNFSYLSITANPTYYIYSVEQNQTVITPSTWWNDSFPKCRNINITSSSALSNYPEYVKITKDSDMNDTFKDLRFINTTCNNTGSELSYELDNYTANDATFWVLMNMSAGINQISVYYGNASAESKSNGTTVFGLSYSAVYHMNNLNATESIGNTVPAVSGAGPIINQNGAVTQALNYTNPSYTSTGKTTLPVDTDTDLSNLSAATVEIWVNSSNAVNMMMWVQSQGSCSYNFLLSTYNAIIGTNSIKLCYRDQSGTTRYCADSNVNLSGSWQYVVGTYAFGGAVNDSRIYVDGLKKGNRTTSYLLRTGPATTTYLANGCDFGSFYGSLDEVRISKTTLSDAWINQTFQTVNNTASMITIGNEINNGGITDPCACPGSTSTAWSINVADYCYITSNCVAGAFIIYGDSGNFSTATNILINASSIKINATNSKIRPGTNNKWWTR